MLDGRLEGSDRFGAWRINADIMSYEVFPSFKLWLHEKSSWFGIFVQELVELSDRIGYVGGGLQEEEILDCLRRPKKSFLKSCDFNSKVKDSKCSICQVSSSQNTYCYMVLRFIELNKFFRVIFDTVFYYFLDNIKSYITNLIQ